MAVLYALIRGIAVFLRKRADASHARAKTVYEAAEKAFQDLENDCKSEEVTVGRPVSYPQQIELLKHYEANERARQKWLKARQRLTRWQKRASRVESFSGRKIPYTFGLIDMALVMRALDFFGAPVELDFHSIYHWASTLVSQWNG